LPSGLENGNAEFAFARFRIQRPSTHPTHLLVVDCETRRFTIERPSSVECFDLWCREVDHAVIAGRHIVCVPVSGSSIEEIESLGTGLGYVLWPSMTILAPPIAKLADDHSQPAAGPKVESKTEREDELKLRLLARLGIT
jgi:hypothetical protein